MSLYRISVLVAKELRHGAGNLFFILAIVYPVVLSLLVSLVFGDIFDQKPRLGVLDEGDSAVTRLLTDASQLDTRLYTGGDDLRADTENGVVAMGIVIPANFDSALASGTADLTRYIWAEAPANDQLTINSALQQAYLDVTGTEPPVTLDINQLGEENTLTWTQRLLPLLVIATIILGGLLLPASALVDEKANRTLLGLTVTPTTLLEVYVSKAIIGVVISTVMAMVVLVINNAFGNDPALLVGTLALGSITASVAGVILGTFINSVTGLMAVTKALGFVLFMPGFLAIFPDIPEWIQQVFPTYYMMNPVIEISQNNANLGDIAIDLGILLALSGAMILYLVSVFERQQQKLALNI
jgi:ABC-2 type transport system permease protein